MKKRIICLAVFLALLCRGVSPALAEGGLAAALASDPAKEHRGRFSVFREESFFIEKIE